MYVFTLRAGDPAEFTLNGEEGVLVSLSAQNFTVTVDGTAFDMQGRDGVFAAVSDWMYLPVGSQVAIAGTSGEVAIVTARASQAFPVH
jgi:5-deoxy-glucuronate isomerase